MTPWENHKVCRVGYDLGLLRFGIHGVDDDALARFRAKFLVSSVWCLCSRIGPKHYTLNPKPCSRIEDSGSRFSGSWFCMGREW